MNEYKYKELHAAAVTKSNRLDKDFIKQRQKKQE